MDCTSATLAGIKTGCKDNMGGIKEAYIMLLKDLQNSNLTVEEAFQTYQLEGENNTEYDTDAERNSYHTIITIDTTAAGLFQKYTFRKQTGGLTSTLTVDDTVGTQYWTNSLTLQFSKMETVKAIEINALTVADSLVIVKDSNNKYWLLGYDNPVSTTEATGQTGTAYGDLNGYTITLTDMSKFLPYEVTDTAMKTVIDAIKDKEDQEQA